MNLFNNSNYYIGGIIFNLVIIDMSIFFMYKFVKETLGKSSGILVVFLALLTIPLHIYSSYFYTDTISMIFPLIMLLIYLKYCRKDLNKSKKYLYALLMGIVAGFGFMFKTIVLLTAISIILFDIFVKNIKNIKYIGIMIISIIVTIFAIYQLLYLSKVLDKKSVYDNSFPYSYWRLIGLNYQGSFNNIEDYNEVKKIIGKNEKKEYILNKIKYKIEYDVNNKILHKIIGYNIKNTWGDPTYYAYVKLSGKSINNDQKIKFYIKSGVKKNVDEVMKLKHIFMLTFMIISGFNLKDKDGLITISKIVIIGLALFLILFESRSRYLVSYIPLLLILEVHGINIIYNLMCFYGSILNKNINSKLKKYKR